MGGCQAFGRLRWAAAGFQELKGGPAKLDQQVMARRVNWLNSIRDWQQEFVGSLSAREFVDCITDDLLGQGVFVFTPSGAVMRLPKVRLPPRLARLMAPLSFFPTFGSTAP